MRLTRILVILIFSTIIKSARDSLIINDPEEDMDVVEVIRYHGYPVEDYDVTTKDGYFLRVQRIPYGKGNKHVTKERDVVLLHHGIMSSSSCWVANTPDKNLPYSLAEEGYDVWLGNTRGNSQTSRHKTLSTDDEHFWKFSFDEMAMYDLPAIIELIMTKTGSSRLHFIGHSMGTTILFCLLSSDLKYNEKIRSFHALAPVTRIEHFKNPIYSYLLPYVERICELMKVITGGKMMFRTPISRDFCKSTYGRYLCKLFFFLSNGFDEDQFNQTRLPVFMNLYVDGSSVQTFEHFAQIAYYHRFQAFNYGKEKNLKLYNQTIPPLYDIKKITAPVALYWGENDLIADPRDVKALSKLLQFNVLNYRVPFDNFSHMDMLLAKDVVPLLHKKILETMKKF